MAPIHPEIRKICKCWINTILKISTAYENKIGLENTAGSGQREPLGLVLEVSGGTSTETERKAEVPPSWNFEVGGTWLPAKLKSPHFEHKSGGFPRPDPAVYTRSYCFVIETVGMYLVGQLGHKYLLLLHFLQEELIVITGLSLFLPTNS